MDKAEIGKIDPYVVLGIRADADARSVKKAYHKLCLQYHPDKNEGFRQEFDRVQLAYMVLSDEKKRKRYDKTGVLSVDDSGDFDWEAYFEGEFNEVTKEMIEKDRKEYQGSEEERDDIRKELIEAHGNMERLFESVIHLEFSKDEEDRVYKICEELVKEIDHHAIPQWEKYVKERKKRVLKLERRRKREARDASESANDIGDVGQLQMMIAGNARRRKSQFDDILDKYSQPQKKAKKKKT